MSVKYCYAEIEVVKMFQEKERKWREMILKAKANKLKDVNYPLKSHNKNQIKCSQL